jgi:hypothetical protein
VQPLTGLRRRAGHGGRCCGAGAVARTASPGLLSGGARSSSRRRPPQQLPPLDSRRRRRSRCRCCTLDSCTTRCGVKLLESGSYLNIMLKLNPKALGIQCWGEHDNFRLLG